MPYFVSRQRYWHSGEEVVEIVQGGHDHASPDMLVPCFAGEGQDHDDPREAVAVALDVADDWAKKLGHKPLITFTNELNDLCLPDPEKLTKRTRKLLIELADRLWKALPKCARCGGLLPERSARNGPWGHDLCDGHPFCSEFCVDEDYAEQCQEDASPC